MLGIQFISLFWDIFTRRCLTVELRVWKWSRGVCLQEEAGIGWHLSCPYMLLPQGLPVPLRLVNEALPFTDSLGTWSMPVSDPAAGDLECGSVVVASLCYLAARYSHGHGWLSGIAFVEAQVPASLVSRLKDLIRCWWCVSSNHGMLADSSDKSH